MGMYIFHETSLKLRCSRRNTVYIPIFQYCRRYEYISNKKGKTVGILFIPILSIHSL